jgi:hypothetical protein
MSELDAVSVRDICAVMNLNERRCGTIAEATEAMHAVMKAARATGKAGTVTIKFKVAPDKNDELALTIEADVSSSVPKPERRKALVYHDAETRTFSRTDPRQLELLAEKDEQRREREAELAEKGIARIGRGAEVATA